MACGHEPPPPTVQPREFSSARVPPIAARSRSTAPSAPLHSLSRPRSNRPVRPNSCPRQPQDICSTPRWLSEDSPPQEAVSVSPPPAQSAGHTTSTVGCLWLQPPASGHGNASPSCTSCCAATLCGEALCGWQFVNRPAAGTMRHARSQLPDSRPPKRSSYSCHTLKLAC